MEDLARIRFLTANYPMLQGLKYIPQGLLVILMSLWGNTLHGPARDLTVPIIITVSCALLYGLIDRYYAHTFGNVHSLAHVRYLEWTISTLGAVLALGAFALDVSPLHLPISTLGLVFAATLLGEYFRLQFTREPFLLYFPVIALLMIILSLLPLFGIEIWQDLLGVKSSVLGVMLIFGVLVIVAGLLGHWFLVHSLPPVQEANHDKYR